MKVGCFDSGTVGERWGLLFFFNHAHALFYLHNNEIFLRVNWQKLGFNS